MKKILAFVLAIAMVLGMATVGFAAPGTGKAYLSGSTTFTALTALAAGDAVITKMPTVTLTFTTNATAYKAAAADTVIGTIKVDVVPGEFWVAADTDKVQTVATEPTQYFAPTVAKPTVTDNNNNAYTATQVTGTNLYTVTNNVAITAVMAPTAYNAVAAVTVDITTVAASTTDPAILLTWNAVATGKYVAPVVTAVDAEVVEELYAAYNGHNDTVTVDLTDASIYNKTISAADWNWLLNTYKGMPSDLATTYIAMTYDSNGNPATFATAFANGVFTGAADASTAVSLKTMGIGDWWKTANWQYLAMNFKFVDGTTLFFIKAADIDYTWNTPVAFGMDDGLSGYIKTGTTAYTSAEMYNFIRALTGDTKNPYTFGWTCAKAGVEVAVPTMTVSYVIPQQWINVYGHKNLALWVYGNSEKCEVCGSEHQMGHVITTTTLDATTQTQRIEFTTNYFYRTLVLSQTATEAASEPTDDNPNTGANDIVNVAIVFAVISLVAAGAFVFSKQR